ncbi:DUF3794 domain-containing protein [Lutibacter sp. B2]|nr:DUF3794 domain-containing protein [Lutibacter sp. B2]
MHKKLIQVPVIIGKGSKQTLVVTELQISPPSPPVFRVKDIDEKVVITNKKVIPGKVIINGFIDKNINYKTLEHFHDGAVNGPLYHYTAQIPFSTFIDVIPNKGEEITEGDNCEILEAFVEGEKTELLCPVSPAEHGESCDPKPPCPPPVYRKLLEKSVVKIVVKITRIEHIEINAGCQCHDQQTDEL